MNRIIHPAGQKLFLKVVSLYLIITLSCLWISSGNIWIIAVLGLTGLALTFLFLFFFRNPSRKLTPDNNKVFAPADGKIVAIEEVFENEICNRNCNKISIFM